MPTPNSSKSQRSKRPSATLLFDEGDALFGKRSEVKDSSDRYANIELAQPDPPKAKSDTKEPLKRP